MTDNFLEILKIPVHSKLSIFQAGYIKINLHLDISQ